MQNSTVSTRYGPCFTPKAAANKILIGRHKLGYLTSYSVTVFITAVDFKSKDIVISIQYLSRSEKCRSYINWPCWPS